MTRPLTPADCDLRDFPRMMIDIPRLFGSEFDATATDAEWRCGVTLWLKSFHQVPAASLPDDDAQLARLCGLGRDVKTWRKCRTGALRGWLKADDGLLYHPVVAEIALEAWLEKLTQRLSSGAGNAARWGTEFDPEPIKAEIGAAAALLADLNPKSKALAKQQVSQSLRKSRRDTHPEFPTGAEEVPSGSQGKGREEKDNPPLPPQGGEQGSGQEEGRRKPKRSIPADFPTADLIEEQQAKARESGANVDARYQAERFRNWAEGKDAKYADWPATWRNWMLKAIREAPRGGVLPLSSEPPPDPWRSRVRGLKQNACWNALDWGPKPGAPGCECPPEILREFGIEPMAPTTIDGRAA